MKRSRNKNLVLARETVRDLAPRELGRVGGAGKITNGLGDGYGCSTNTCGGDSCLCYYTADCEPDTIYECGATKTACVK